MTIGKAVSLMDLEHLSEYIIPLLLLLYFVFGKKKQKPREKEPVFQDHFEEQAAPPRQESTFDEPLPPSSRSANRSLPPVQRKLSRFESAITTRHLSDQIEERRYVSSISDERAQDLVSAGMTEHISLDQAYALKSRQQPSRGQAILKRLPSLQDAFILQEIMKRYDEQ